LVYIEEFDKKNKTVLFDFYDSNEFSMFSDYTNSSLSIDKPTMILLKNYNGRNIQENTYYSIKRETVSNLWKSIFTSESENSFLIAFSINLSNFDFAKQIFSHSVSVNNDFEST